MNSFTNDEKQAVYKAIYGRRDVRTFLSDEIPNETVYNILQAAHSGPSVGFMQPWNFILVSDTEVKNKLAWAADKERRALAIHYEGEKKEDFLELKIQGLKEAPLTICVTCDPTRGWLACSRKKLNSRNRYDVNCVCDSKYVACFICRRTGNGVGKFL